MITYRTLSRKASAFRSLSGLTVKEFELLFEEILQRYEEAEDVRLDRPGRQRRRGAGRQFKNDVRDRLLMTLIWLRVYPTYEVLGFDLHKSNISRNLKLILPLLQEVSERELKWPVEGQRKKHLAEIMAEFPEVQAIVDATEQPIRRPKDKDVQKTYYSGKKKRHTLKTQIVVAPDGLLREVSTSVAGSVPDISLLRQSHTLDRLDTAEAAMFDAGYQGVRKDAPDRSLYHPYRASRGHPLTDEQKAANRVLSHYRIVVEHTLAQLKRFQVLAQVYRHARDLYNLIFRIVAGLTNRRIAGHPLAAA
jgi:transposase